MIIDLSKCVLNQKVVTRQGEIGTYLGVSTEPNYPCRVRLEDGIEFYTQEGYLLSEFDINGRDIVEILPVGDSPGANSELLEENAKLKVQLADWDRILAKCDALKDECEALKSENETLKHEILAIALRLTGFCRKVNFK